MSRKRQTEADLSDLVKLGVSIKKRTVTITGEINDVLFKKLSVLFDEFSEEISPVTLKICSGGGYEHAARAIAGLMQAQPFVVNTQGFGDICSAATLILAAGSHREISSIAFFMHHESYYGLEGRHSTVKDEVKHWENDEKLWAEAMEKFTGKNKQFWKRKGVRKDAWFNAEQLLKLGVVDAIIKE